MKKLIPFLMLFTQSAFSEVPVNFSDEITPRSLSRLESNIRKAAGKMKAGDERRIVIDLSSGGGNLYAALSFVRRINQISGGSNVVIDTRVRSSCESSCTILFTAGNKRRAGRGASFGFHSPAIGSRVPRGMNREMIIEEARRVWLEAIGAVDPGLSFTLERRRMLLRDEMTFLSRSSLTGGYVTDFE